MNKSIFNIILYALMGVSALFIILYFVGVVSEGMFLNWSYILMGVATVAAIVFPILNIIKNPKQAKMVIAGVIGLAVLFGIAYAMSEGHQVKLGEENIISASTVKMSDAGLNLVYILGTLSILTVIYAEVSKMFK